MLHCLLHCSWGGPRAQGVSARRWSLQGAFRNPAATRGHPLTQSEAQLRDHLPWPNRGLRMRPFLAKNSSSEHKQNEGMGLSVQRCFNTWADSPWTSSDISSPHRHTSAIHILNPGTRERLTHQEPHSPLTLWWYCSVCVSSCSLPAPTTPSFVSIRAFRMAWWSNTVAHSWICSLIQLCHPPQHTNAPFGSITHRDFLLD